MTSQLQTTCRPITATATTRARPAPRTTNLTTMTTTIPTTKKSRLLLLQSSATRTQQQKQQMQKQQYQQQKQHNNVTTLDHHEHIMDDAIRLNKKTLWNSSSSSNHSHNPRKDHHLRMSPKQKTATLAESLSPSYPEEIEQQQEKAQEKAQEKIQEKPQEKRQQQQQQQQKPQEVEETQTNGVIIQEQLLQQQQNEWKTNDCTSLSSSKTTTITAKSSSELSSSLTSLSLSNISLPRDWYYLSIKEMKRYIKHDPTWIKRPPEEQSTIYYDDDNGDNNTSTPIKNLLPLHISIQEHCSYTMIEYLYSLYPDAIEYSCGKYQWLPIHYAIANQLPYDIVELLIRYYPNGMKQKDYYDNYPINLLMDDYNPNNSHNLRRSRSSNSANSSSSCSSSSNNSSSSSSSSSNQNNNSNSFKVLKIMIRYDPDCIQYIGEDGNTILHRAIICGFSYRMMKYMIQYNNNKMNNILQCCYNNYHQLPIHCINEHPLLLHTSSSQHYIQLIQYVIDCYPESLCIIGGSNNSCSNNNDIVIGTPLHIAIRKGFSYPIIQKMIRTNPSILQIPDYDNHLPYYYMYQYCLLNDTYSLMTTDYNHHEEMSNNNHNSYSHSHQPNNDKSGIIIQHSVHDDDDDNDCDALAVIKLMMESVYQQHHDEDEMCPLHIMLISSLYNNSGHHSNIYWNRNFANVIQYIMKQYPKLCSYRSHNQLPLHILCQLVAITAKEVRNRNHRLCGRQQQHLFYLVETIQLSLQLYPDSIKSYDTNGYLPFHTLLYGIDDNSDDDNDDCCSYVPSTVRSLLILLLDLYPLALEISPHTQRRNKNCTTTTPSTITIDSAHDSSHIQEMKRIRAKERLYDSPIERLMYIASIDHGFCFDTFIYILKKYPHILQIPCIRYNDDSPNNYVSQEDSNEGMLPLHVAFQCHDIDIDKIRQIIAFHYPNALTQIDSNGYTPFHYGCMNHILNQSYERFNMNYYIQLCPNTVIHKTLQSSCYRINSISSTLSTASLSGIRVNNKQLLGEENGQIPATTNPIIMMPQQSNKFLPLFLACENNACLDIIYGLMIHSMNELF